MTTINLEYCGMAGSGPTVKEAKQDAARKIQAALDGSYDSILIRWRGEIAVLSRHPTNGWGYCLIHDDKPLFYTWHLCGGFTDRAECLKSATKHIAGITRKEGERDCGLFDSLPKHLAQELRRGYAVECERDDEFQQRFRKATARGMSHNDAHAYAGRNPFKPELWQHEERA